MKILSQTTDGASEIVGIQCNLCGAAIDKNELGYFEDHVTIKKTWGFHSLMDGERHELDVCALCYRDWVSRCTLSPLIEK